MAEEIEVEFGGDFLIDAFVDVVVLVRWLALPALEVLVELVDVLEQQVEGLLDWVVDDSDRPVALGNASWEGRRTDEHALQHVDHFYLELRVRNLLVYRQKNV